LRKASFFIFYFSVLLFLSAQEAEPSRLNTIKYGTETEIAALIQQLKTEGADYLDNELMALVDNTHNTKILSGVFTFFGDREKNGLEDRAIRAIEERDDEANETVLAAADYLGKVKAAKAAPALRELLDSREKRFMNTAFRALGRAADKDNADETAEYLIDYYENRDPGDENQRDLITAIGATGSVKAVPFLTEIAGNQDERIALRIAALDALSKLGDSGGLDTILNCITANDPNVRASAVAALGPYSGEQVDDAILEAFRDSYYRTRIAAAQASRQRRLVAAVPYLKFRAERDENPNVKDEAINALGAIAGTDAAAVLDALFTERKNSDRVRLASAEQLMKNDPASYLGKMIVELDEAKKKNLAPLYNGFLKIIGEAKTGSAESIARRFMQSGGVIEKSYGLDLAANNNLSVLAEEIKGLAADKNESLARTARRTAEKLGIEL
jgi:HEAT repeat protein